MDPSFAVQPLTCTNDETGEVKKVGGVHALRVHAGLARDAYSGELQHLHTLLYDPDGYAFQEPLSRMFDAIETNLLVLDVVGIAPKWRKSKLGLLAVRRLLDLVGGGCGLAVSFIAPLRHDAATLRRYFRRMGRSPYYALSMSQVAPGATELLGGRP